MSEVPEWYPGFVAEVVAHLPRDMTEAGALRWVRQPRALEAYLRGLLVEEEGLPVTAPGATRATPSLDAVQAPGSFQHDKAKEGWKLIRDAEGPTSVSMSSVELAPILDEGESDLLGDEMVERASAVDAELGQRHAEHLLERQESIPEEFRRFSLIFLGTIWLGSDRNHHVPCLLWRRDKWELQFGILEAGVDSNDMMVRPKA